MKVANAAKNGVRRWGCGSYRGGRGRGRKPTNKDNVECYNVEISFLEVRNFLHLVSIDRQADIYRVES